MRRGGRRGPLIAIEGRMEPGATGRTFGATRNRAVCGRRARVQAPAEGVLE
jgi:hypothetical protein